jgi:hypothetical protein
MAATPGSGSGTNRILLSDVDRDQLVELLAHHNAAGRFGTDELERRVAVVYAAQSRDQVAAVIGDLPPLDPGRPPPPRLWRRGGHGEADEPGLGWLATDERFRDPRTRRIMRVWVDPASGARHYVPDQAD